MRSRPTRHWLLPGLAPRCPVHTPRLFRALLCHATADDGGCGRAWVAHSAESLRTAEQARDAHQTLCASGLYRAAGV